MIDVYKQELLLSYIISSPELFIKVSPILDAGYFDPKLKSAVVFIQEFFNKYKAPPTPEQIKAETKKEISVRPAMSKQDLLYAENELETFCRNSAMEHAILTGHGLIEKGDHGTILAMMKDAVTISLQRNIGLDYFADPEKRLKALALNSAPIPTRFAKLDEHLNGGINRKEMIIFAAPPGVGKSLTMANLAKNLMAQGLNGVYVTMELSEEVVAKRFDSMFSGISQQEILRNITKTSIEIAKQGQNHGKLFIKRMPESSTHANHLRAYLKEFEIEHGFVPDFMVVDYMDLMCSVQQISAENTFIRDKFISEELRAIANEYNMLMITASQLNRSAQLLENIDDLSQAHIAGGISKANTTDNMIAIIQTPSMKARGEMMFKLLKTRSSGGVGHHYMMRFDAASLLLFDMIEDGGSSQMSKQISSYVRGKVAGQQPQPSTAEEKKPAGKLSINNLPFQV